MTCEELNGLLDALLDDALTDEQRQAMVAHGRDCPECAAAIRATLQMKALFADMPAEVDVPLAAQAQWRGAVREEARRRRGRRTLRWISTAAAAVVALVGVSVALNSRNAPRLDNSAALLAGKSAPEIVEEAAVESDEAEAPALGAAYDAEADAAYDAGAVPMANAAPVAEFALEDAGEAAEITFDAAQSAVVETDGLTGDAVELPEAEPLRCAAEAQRAPACQLDMKVGDVDAACKLIADLAQEYEGAADVQRLEGGGANAYVELPAENAGDFIRAVAPMDAGEGTPEAPDLSGEGTVLVLLAISPSE